MYGHDSAAQSRIYSFGAKAPTKNAELVRRQHRLAHRHRNDLVAAERERREAVDEAIRTMFPRIGELETEIADVENELANLRDEVKKRNAAARRKTATKKDRDAIGEVKKRLKALRADRKAARKEAFGSEGWKTRQKEIDSSAYTEKKRLYNQYGEEGVHWGTRLTVDQAASKLRSGPPPRFKRWDGDAKIAVQCIKGLSIEDAFAGRNAQFQLDEPPGGVGKTIARVRIGSHPDRKPIWTEIPVTIHRPIPPGCKVKWAYYPVTRIGTREEWRFQLVLSSDDPSAFDPGDRSTSGVVALDVNWRLTDDGLRVAYWISDDGEEGSLTLPMDRVESWDHCERLQSIRDLHFDGARETLALWIEGAAKPPGWLRDHANWLRANMHRAKKKERQHRGRELAAFEGLIEAWGDAREIPDWLRERARHIRRWRSAARLASVSIAWRNQRFDGDGAVFAWLNEWRKRDKHLYDWMASRRVKNSRWRDDFYRKFAASLRRKYRVVVIEDTNWRQAAALPMPEEKQTDAERAARIYRRVASAGRLLEVVRESMTETVRVAAKNTTQTCAYCGHVGGIDASNLVVECPECGRREDQDRRAARNMLANLERAPEAA